MGRSASNLCNQQDESFNQDVISIVERTMKKHSDNLLRFLEGISGRLSQLELYCCNLERSIGDFCSGLIRDHNKADLKLRSLEKHLQEVHRFVQIPRDKQEITDAQKEITKFQLAQKESLHHNEEAGVSSTESKNHENASEAQSQQLALALPQQTTTPTSLPVPIQPYKELPVQQQPVPSMPPQQQVHVQTLPNTYYPSRSCQVSHPRWISTCKLDSSRETEDFYDGVLRKLAKADWKDSFEMIINQNQRASRMNGWDLFLPGGKVHAEATPKKASNITNARGPPKHICRSRQIAFANWSAEAHPPVCRSRRIAFANWSAEAKRDDCTHRMLLLPIGLPKQGLLMWLKSVCRSRRARPNRYSVTKIPWK